MGLADDHKITGVGRVVGHLDAVAFFDRGCLLDAHPDLPADSVAVDDQDGELREVIAGCAVDVLDLGMGPTARSEQRTVQAVLQGPF